MRIYFICKLADNIICNIFLQNIVRSVYQIDKYKFFKWKFNCFFTKDNTSKLWQNKINTIIDFFHRLILFFFYKILLFVWSKNIIYYLFFIIFIIRFLISRIIYDSIQVKLIFYSDLFTTCICSNNVFSNLSIDKSSYICFKTIIYKFSNIISKNWSIISKGTIFIY